MAHVSRRISTDKSSFLVIGNLLYISQTRVNLGTHPVFRQGVIHRIGRRSSVKKVKRTEGK